VEADTPLHKQHWFWHPDDESTLKSLPELIATYEQTVGRGGQLMLGIAPDRRGLLPETDAKRLQEFGASIKQRYGNNLALTHAPGNKEMELALDGNPDTFWSALPASHSAGLEVNFAKPVTFNHTLTMEWLNAGQHVEKYTIDVYRQGKWMQVAAGQAIGHKKIDTFSRVTASRIRLNILSSSAEAHIREFKIFDLN
jgi:alpha-L-fucosidase